MIFTLLNRFMFSGLAAIFLIMGFIYAGKQVNSQGLKACENFNDSIFRHKYLDDLSFLKKYTEIIELADGDARLIVAPGFQGRVLTSTGSGLNGSSHGWINYPFIEKAEINEFANPFGGEERIWLGPEGGAFSMFFNSDSVWSVPDEFDHEPFDVIDEQPGFVKLSKDFRVTNKSGTVFTGNILRSITILSQEEIAVMLGIHLAKTIDVVGYQSQNKLTNTGINKWERETGTISIWMLSMLKATDFSIAVIPIKKTKDFSINDYYNNLTDDRLKVKDSCVLLKADSKFKSKIGIKQKNATSFVGSYDAKYQTLTIIHYNIPQTPAEYVNSSFDPAENPFNGDVINIYNDGPEPVEVKDGPFYELETSSPAAFLKPGESLTHIQSIFHFEGNTTDLDFISKSILKVSLEELK